MKKAVVLFSLIFITLEASANDNIFTLNEIIERALMVSPNLEVINKELDISESQVKKARSKKFPQFNGAIISGGIFSVFRADLFQPIFTFGKISSAEGAAKKGVEATMAKISESRNDTIDQATKTYYKLQLAYTLKDLAIEGRDQTKKVLISVEELVRGGSPKATQIDKLNLTVLLSNINKDVVGSEKAVKLTRVQLKMILGIEENVTFDIDSHSLEPVKYEFKGLDYYTEKALKDRPQIKAIEAGLEARKYSIKKEKSEYYPTFFIGGTIRYNTSPLFDDTFIGGAGLGIKQTLNFTISADLSEARAEYSKSLKEKDALLKEMDFDVEKAYLDVKENRDKLEYDKEGFTAAKTLLRNATSNYDLGIGNVNDLMNALGTYLREGGEYYETVFLYNTTATNLEKVTGDLEKELRI